MSFFWMFSVHGLGTFAAASSLMSIPPTPSHIGYPLTMQVTGDSVAMSVAALLGQGYVYFCLEKILHVHFVS